MVKRSSLKHSIIKQVIFRVDFSNVLGSDVENLISTSLRSFYFENGYEKFWNEYENSVDINIPKINEDGGPQFSNYSKFCIWCFYGEDEYMKKTIRISEKYFSIILSTKTKYTSFSKYEDIIRRTIKDLRTKVKELRFNKISMRKINACIICDFEKISNYFNECVFDIDNSINKYGKDRFNALSNSIATSNNKININYIRNLQRGVDAKNSDDLYQAVLDLNSYVDDTGTLQSINDDTKLISIIERINTELYNTYIIGLTDSFINELKKDVFDDKNIRMVN